MRNNKRNPLPSEMKQEINCVVYLNYTYMYSDEGFQKLTLLEKYLVKRGYKVKVQDLPGRYSKHAWVLRLETVMKLPQAEDLYKFLSRNSMTGSFNYYPPTGFELSSASCWD